MAWQDFYGYRSTPYTDPSGSDFTSNDLRDARRAGYTGMSILEWLKPEGTRNPMDHATEPGVWTGATAAGRIDSPERLALMQELRGIERSELAQRSAYEALQSQLAGYARSSDIPDTSGFARSSDIPSLEGYARSSDIPDISNLATTDSLSGYVTTTDAARDYARAGDVSDLRSDVSDLQIGGLTLAGRVGDVESQQEQHSTDIASNLAEAMKVRTTSAQPVQNQATPIGIQSAQSPSAQAGMISAGLAGLSRNNKKFKNKTLNI